MPCGAGSRFAQGASFLQVYAQGALRADREGWVAQARKPSLDASAWTTSDSLVAVVSGEVTLACPSVLFPDPLVYAQGALRAAREGQIA